MDNATVTILLSVFASVITALLTYFTQRPKLKSESEAIKESVRIEIEKANEIVFKRLQQTIDTLGENLEKSELKIEALEKEIERLMVKSEQERASCSKELEEKSKKITALTRKLANETKQRQKLESEIKTLTNRVKLLEEENKNLKELREPNGSY